LRPEKSSWQWQCRKKKFVWKKKFRKREKESKMIHSIEKLAVEAVN